MALNDLYWWVCEHKGPIEDFPYLGLVSPILELEEAQEVASVANQEGGVPKNMNPPRQRSAVRQYYGYFGGVGYAVHVRRLFGSGDIKLPANIRTARHTKWGHVERSARVRFVTKGAICPVVFHAKSGVAKYPRRAIWRGEADSPVCRQEPKQDYKSRSGEQWPSSVREPGTPKNPSPAIPGLIGPIWERSKEGRLTSEPRPLRSWPELSRCQPRSSSERLRSRNPHPVGGNPKIYRITLYRSFPMKRWIAVAVIALFSTGCYHAVVETGRPMSMEKVEKKWASGWVYGLVPPKTVETAEKCPNGAARVDTQLSFANQLVNFLTLGIYTPMEVVATCAGPVTG